MFYCEGYLISSITASAEGGHSKLQYIQFWDIFMK